MTNKIKLVAIAKDEAAYIPEWVHHHLFLGFDEIEIFINRTTDNSEQVLTQISAQYPTVQWDYADWIDWCPPDASKHIQFITYANAMHKCQQQGGYSHIFFLDIDEFLILDNLKSTIHSVAESFPKNTPISFEWVNDCTPEADAFSSLPQTLVGNLSPLVKTLLPVNIKIDEFRHHLPLFKDNVKALLVDRSAFVPQPKIKQALAASANSLKSSFIYHRAHRSQFEYISLLYRGRPGDTFAYKSNRRGYPKLKESTSTVQLDIAKYNEYQKSFAEFLSQVSPKNLKEAAKQFVIQRYNASIDNLTSHLFLDYPLMLRLFSGVQDENVLSAFKSYRKHQIDLTPDNVELLVHLAEDAETQNIQEAISLLTQAKKLRPNGPLINKRLKRLTDTLKAM